MEVVIVLNHSQMVKKGAFSKKIIHFNFGFGRKDVCNSRSAKIEKPKAAFEKKNTFLLLVKWNTLYIILHFSVESRYHFINKT